MNEIVNLGNGQFVKITMLKGEKGSNIASIELTGTTGLVDTYTVTLTDGSTSTFTVTNGSSIESIEKTSTVGAVDTYTITLTNGETSTFTVTNATGAVDDSLSPVSTNAIENQAVANAVMLPAIKTTTFPSDGSILDTYSATKSVRTVFNADGSISEIYTDGTNTVEHKTVFNSDGSISVVDVPQS